MTWVLVVGAALVPALVMWSVVDAQRGRARAWWLLGVGVVAAGALAPREPWLTVLALCLLAWWVRAPDALLGRRGQVGMIPVLAAWLAVAATWVLAREIPAGALWVVLAGWGVLGLAQVALMAAEHRKRRLFSGWAGSATVITPLTLVALRAPRGGFGQRMYAGCFLAVLCCLLPIWAWPGLLLGLWLSGPSWLACLALVAGSAVRWPQGIPWLLIVVLGATVAIWGERWIKNRRAVRGVWGYYPVDRWTSRGDTLKTVWQRWRIVRHAVKDLLRAPWSVWLLGFGPGTAGVATQRWDNQSEDPAGVEALGNLHNEPLQVAYEFGALGLLGLGLFAWRVGSGLTWGDPWSAAAVAGGVIALGSNLSGVIPLALTCLVVWARVAP